MKKILLLLVTAAAGFLSANAQPDETLVLSAGQLKKLEIGDGMNVILVRSTEDKPAVKGSTALFEKISVSVSNGTLHIRPRGTLSQKETIMVVVEALERITLGQNTKLETQGVLPGKEVTVFVQQGATARLLTAARINAFAADDVDVQVNRRFVQASGNTRTM